MHTWQSMKTKNKIMKLVADRNTFTNVKIRNMNEVFSTGHRLSERLTLRTDITEGQRDQNKFAPIILSIWQI